MSDPQYCSDCGVRIGGLRYFQDEKPVCMLCFQKHLPPQSRDITRFKCRRDVRACVVRELESLADWVKQGIPWLPLGDSPQVVLLAAGLRTVRAEIHRRIKALEQNSFALDHSKVSGGRYIPILTENRVREIVREELAKRDQQESGVQK